MKRFWEVLTRMTQLDIRTETIRYWLDELEKRFRPAIIQRGYEYAVQGKVSSFHAETGAARVYVEGSKLYAVKLDSGFFGLSSCSCPFDGYCKHLSAAVFRACMLAGLNLEAVVAEVLRPKKSAARAAVWEAAAGKEDQLELALEEIKGKKTQAKGMLSKDAVAPEWQAWLKRHMERSTSGMALANMRQTLADAVYDTTRDWPEQTKLLFQLYAEMALMNSADQLARKYDVLYNVSYNGPSIEKLVQTGMKQLESLINRLDAASLWSTHAEHIQLVRKELGNHPFELSSSNIDWLWIYRLLWWEVLNDAVTRQEEERRIKEMLQNDRMISQKRELLRCAHIHLQLRRGEGGDEDALAAIQTLQLYGTPEWWMFYLERFGQEGAWKRLIGWLRWMLPYMSASSGAEQLATYMEQWKQAAEHTPCEQEWKETLLRLLPASYVQYEDYLIARHDYRAWADIQMSMGLTASQLNPERLAQAESAEPRTVVPLLHQAVEHHISRRNREDYRLAVKYLKQLERLYRRIERVDVWQEFMRQLHNRYSRLRSLQEELKKGGLRA